MAMMMSFALLFSSVVFAQSGGLSEDYEFLAIASGGTFWAAESFSQILAVFIPQTVILLLVLYVTYWGGGILVPPANFFCFRFLPIVSWRR